MKPSKRQPVSKSISREGRREATARGRRIRAATDLSNCPDFDLQYGDEWSGGSPCDYYTLQYRGINAHLRFDHMWIVKVPQLSIEQTFLNQTPQTLAQEINDWIDEHLPYPGASLATQVRQATPAVKDLAQRHNISLAIADEIMLERV